MKIKWKVLGISMVLVLNGGALLAYWFGDGRTLVNWIVTSALVLNILIAGITFLKMEEKKG